MKVIVFALQNPNLLKIKTKIIINRNLDKKNNKKLIILKYVNKK